MKNCFTFANYAFALPLIFSVPTAAHTQEICPAGEVREIKERIATPATFTDILRDRVIVTEGNEWITLPAQWAWDDKPADYVRPKFVDIAEIYVGTPGVAQVEVDVIFQAESRDVIQKIDGSKEVRLVPAITKTVIKRLPSYPDTYTIRQSKIPFDAAKMETATQVKMPIKPSLTFSRDAAYFPKYVTDRFDITPSPIPRVHKTIDPPEVVGRIRRPAQIEEYYGDCEPATP